MLLLANVVFFVGSLICALSINVPMLEAGRVLQGIGGGGLLNLVNICISDLFSMRYVLPLPDPTSGATVGRDVVGRICGTNARLQHARHVLWLRGYDVGDR